MPNRITTTLLGIFLVGIPSAARSAEPRLSLQFRDQAQFPKRVAVDVHGGSDFHAQAEEDGLHLTASTTLSAGRWGGLALTERVPVEPGVTYRLVHESSITSAQYAYTAIAFLPAGGETRRFIPANATQKELEHVFTTPENATHATIRFAIDGPTSDWTLHSLRLERTELQRTQLTAPKTKRPHKTIFPRTAKPLAETLAVLDTRPLTPDERYAAANLQGAVNTTKPRIYLLGRETDERWLELLKEKQHIQGWKLAANLEELFSNYHSEIDGAIVIDPTVPGTRHVATTLAGIQGNKIACTAEIAERFRIPVKTDLRGRWQRNVEAYRWLWETHRQALASHLLAWHHPCMADDAPRDYLLQQRVFNLWVSSPSDSLPAADPDAELSFLHEVLASLPPAIPVLGWPSYGEELVGISEYEALRLLSSYGKYFCGTVFCSNLSLLSGLPAPTKLTQSPLPPLPTAHDPNTVYLALSMIDSGDAAWYWQHHQIHAWLDPARGQVPTTWGLNPTTLDLFPTIIEWFYETATPNDRFASAISGVGYMHVGLFATRYRPQDRKRAWDQYMTDTNTYNARLDLTTQQAYLGIWSEPPLVPDALRERTTARVILGGFGRHDIIDRNAAVLQASPRAPLVMLTMMRFRDWVSSEEIGSVLERGGGSVEANFVVQEALANAPTRRPALMSGMFTSWTVRPTQLVEAAKMLRQHGFTLIIADQAPHIHQQLQVLKRLKKQ